MGEIRLQVGEEFLRELLRLEDWGKRDMLDALIVDTLEGEGDQEPDEGEAE